MHGCGGICLAAPAEQQQLLPAFRPPLPTGGWWTNLVTGKGDQPVAPLPYQVRATARGVDVGYSQPTVTAKDVTYPFVADMSLGFAEPPVPRWVAGAADASKPEFKVPKCHPQRPALVFSMP